MDLRELPSRTFVRHPWETARARFFLRLLRHHVTLDGLSTGPSNVGLSILDYGAGDGFFARTLLDAWPSVGKVVCFDPAYPAERADTDTHGRRISFTRDTPHEPCDVLVLLDVIEHAANDQAVLHGALSSCLRAGGWLLLSVPAHPILFSRHDQVLGHKRRYSPADLLALASNENVVVVEQGQLFASLLVPRALTKLAETLRPGRAEPTTLASHVDTSVGTWNHGRMLTRTVEAALGLDAAVARRLARGRLSIPGLSTWLLARKK